MKRKFDLSAPADLRIAAPERAPKAKVRARKNGRRVWDTTSVNYNRTSKAAFSPRYEQRAHEPEFRRAMVAQEAANHTIQLLGVLEDVKAFPELLTTNVVQGFVRRAETADAVALDAARAAQRAAKKAAQWKARMARRAAESKE